MGTYTYIFELLYSHDCVIFPGLGGFVANYRPAKIHPVLHTFSPPAKELMFNPRLQGNDGVLANYIANKESITYDEALGLLQEQALHINTLLNQSQRFEILNVGVLYKDIEGSLKFEASNQLNFLLSSYGLSEFISPAIERERNIRHYEPRPFRTGQTPNKNRISSTVKRTALIGVPVMALAALAWFSAGNIGNWIAQTTDLLPKISFPSYNLPENSGSSAVLAKKAVQKDIKRTFIAREVIQTIVSENSQMQPASGTFCIVGNCFSIEDNAKRYVKDLQEQGFSGASYLPADGKSLFKAYFGRYTNRSEAETALQKIKKDQAPQAWILEIK